MGLLRYVASLLAGLAVDATAYSLIAGNDWATPFATRLLSALLALAACLFANEAGSRKAGKAFDRRRLRPTLVIATLFNLVLFAAMQWRFPAMQPLAAMVLSWLAGLTFALTGYWRFFRRIG